jgi:anhydro-N-acetylmuramic acid kinase
VDIAYCVFTNDGFRWTYNIAKAETIDYTTLWKDKLRSLEGTDALTFAETHINYGHYLGGLVADFMKKHALTPDFVASHGHTIFHQPEKHFTLQIGDGASMAAECGCTVVCDFRTTDVALGGQGAPLVPIGDRLLFGEHTYCLNMGGFANISFEEKGRRVAFDVCPVNIVLNTLAETTGAAFDCEGNMAATGTADTALLTELNNLHYYHRKPPKSLGKEWVLCELMPLLDKYSISVNDKLRTVCEHIAMQIAETLSAGTHSSVLVTGGGAYNRFLINLIKEKTTNEIVLPDDITINYKEALIFAFLGVLRMRNEVNCLRSVTGATADSTGGAVYRAHTPISY